MCQEVWRVPQVGKGRPAAGVEAPRPLGCPSRNSQPLPAWLPAEALPGNPAHPAPHTGAVFPQWRTRTAQAGRALPFTFHTEFGKQLGGQENHTMASNWEVLHYHCESKVSAQGFIFSLSYGLHKLEPSRLFQLSRYLEPVPASGGI